MDSEHAQLQHWGRQSKDSQQQTFQLVSSDHVTKAGSGKKPLLKLSSDTDRSFAANMMCVIKIISDVGQIFFLELITIT